MSVREFRDSQGRDWRAWDVVPDNLNSRIKNEDFLAALNYTGWIVFETRNETEKRRLYPIPKGWNELPDSELQALVEKAEPVQARRLRGEQGDESTG